MSERTYITCEQRDRLIYGREGKPVVYSGGTDYDPPFERHTTWLLDDGRHLGEVVTLNADLGSINKSVPCKHWVYEPEGDDDE